MEHNVMRLYIGKNHDKKYATVQSIFRLAGSNEDALTYALGFLLARDPALCAALVRLCGIKRSRTFKDDYSVHLQEVTDSRFGRRDIVVQAGGTRIVIEAKIGRAEPSPDQLLKYAEGTKLWNKFDKGIVASLTQGTLSSATQESVRAELPTGISLVSIQWHEVIELVLNHRPSDNSHISQYLFDEFVNYIRKDYDMGYYDAEVLIMDTNLLNAKIFCEGWMCVTWHNSKQAPLYVAPYFTGQGANSGISMISRVVYSETVKLAKHEITPDAETPKQRERWPKGLAKLRKRAEKEGFADVLSRLFYLDQPIAFRSQPLTKKTFNATDPPKKIPNQIPKGFSLRFDELLRV